MQNHNAGDLETNLKRLREQYLDGLPSRVIQIENLWRSLSRGQWRAEIIAELHRHTHTLIGSGATFGFERITLAARKLDRKIQSVSTFSIAPSVDEQSKIRRLISALRLACVETSIAEDDPDAFINTQRVEEFFHPESPWLIVLGSDTVACLKLAEQLHPFNYRYRIINCTEPTSLEELQTSSNGVHFDGILVLYEGDLAASEQSLDLVKRALDYHCPTFFISDKSDIETRLRAVRAGCDAFVTRPLDIAELLSQLDTNTRHNVLSPYRILIVDDCDTLAEAYAMFLQRAGMATRVVNKPMETLNAIVEFNPELILLDMYMPECSGSELARVIRQENHYDSVPIVFLSAESDLEKQLDAMALGGDDFLTKPITAQHLISSVSIRAERYRELRSHMIRDSLTGLYNHTRTEEHLGMELNRAARENATFSYIMLDIDHFKQINDTYGHYTGDEVLKCLARLLRQSLRNTDTIGRYGGEEFVIILSRADTTTARQVMDNIRQKFHAIEHHSDQGGFTVSFSAGIAAFPTYQNSESLKKAADEALYAAKKAGRNQIHIAADSKDAA